MEKKWFQSRINASNFIQKAIYLSDAKVVFGLYLIVLDDKIVIIITFLCSKNIGFVHVRNLILISYFQHLHSEKKSAAK